MRDLYFAYGSNMKSGRLRSRVPSAAPVGVAELSGFRFAMNKRGRDGSAKANVVIEERSRVYGVAFSFTSKHWSILDRFETGYERFEVEISLAGEACEALLYVCNDPQHLISDPTPYDWYRQLMIDGATEHRLPDTYQQMLRSLPYKTDPTGGPAQRDRKRPQEPLA